MPHSAFRRPKVMSAALLLAAACSGPKLKEPVEPTTAATSVEAVAYNCKSAHEFTTTLQFLRQTKGLELPEAPARQIALDVAGGCTGSAGRFIEVVQLLRRAGLDSKPAVEIGRDAARRDDGTARAYQTIFRSAFAKDSLDMDLKDALVLARSLTIDFKGDKVAAEESFAELVDFCVGRRGLDLPRPACGAMAARVARHGAGVKEEIDEAFVDAFEYLTEDDDGPRLTSADALRVAEELVAVSPYALKNFEKAYEFAASKKGLDLDRSAAVKVAHQVAGATASTIVVPR